MAVFRFALERLLEMRRDAVTECERRLEQAYRIRDELKRLLMEERQVYLHERNGLNELVAQGDLVRMPVFERSLEMHKQRMLKILGHLRDVEGEVDLIEQTLRNARRDLKVVENLREKRAAEFHKAQEMRERKMIDEQATLRYLRRENGERWEDGK